MRNDSVAAEFVHTTHGKVKHYCGFLDCKELFHSSKTITILTDSSTLSHNLIAETLCSLSENGRRS